MENVIGLIDCDSFFASCEQADNHELMGKPVCVMSRITDRGIVLARSKEVKALGIKMCDPYFKIKDKYDNVVFISSRMQRYKEISAQVMELVKNFSPVVEIASIDEAYIDLSTLDKVYKKSYAEIGKDIKQEIYDKLKISVSIGISSTKLLAKLASEQAKSSGGIYEIKPQELVEKLGHLPINHVSGIGKQHHKQLQQAKILTISDFMSANDIDIKKALGISGAQIKNELSGILINKIEKDPIPPKSIQSSQAFSEFTQDKYFISTSLNYHIQQACRKLRAWNGYTSVVGVMLRYKDFEMVVKKERLPKKTNSEQEVKEVVTKLFNQLFKTNKIYRSCGISLDDISFNAEVQQSLFSEENQKPKDDELSKAIDALENKFGANIVKTGWL